MITIEVDFKDNFEAKNCPLLKEAESAFQ